MYCVDCAPKRVAVNQKILAEIQAAEAMSKLGNAKEKPRIVELGLQALN